MARGKPVTSEEVERVLTLIGDPMLIIRVGRKLYTDLRGARKRHESQTNPEEGNFNGQE